VKADRHAAHVSELSTEAAERARGASGAPSKRYFKAPYGFKAKTPCVQSTSARAVLYARIHLIRAALEWYRTHHTAAMRKHAGVSTQQHSGLWHVTPNQYDGHGDLLRGEA